MTAPVSSGPDDQTVDAPAIVSPSLPDRADAPVSEVAERFLRAIIANVPLQRIEELHLFSPLRQGTVETGIAVLAAREIVAIAEPVVVAEPENEAEPELPFTPADDDVVLSDESVDDASVDNESADDEPLGDASIVLDEAIASTGDEAFEDDEDVVDEELVTLAELEDAADAEDVSYEGELTAEASADEHDEAEAVHLEEVVTVRPKVERLTVYTARYRYVIKGPERGKWEASVKAEADAPLITVETVVRGVQRRAGEESEIVRYSGAQIARALRMPMPE